MIESGDGLCNGSLGRRAMDQAARFAFLAPGRRL